MCRDYHSRTTLFAMVTVMRSTLLENVTYSRAGCSKLTTSLVNVSLKFQMLISQIFQYFLLEKCEKLFQQKYQCFLVIKS